MFSLCENMKWSHLPVAGGIYDQHPDLIEQWRYIFAKRNEHEHKEHEKREREMRSKKAAAGGGRRVAGRR